MRKFLLSAGLLCLGWGLLTVPSFSASGTADTSGTEQIEITISISPSTIVVRSERDTCVTVHTNIAYWTVNCAPLRLTNEAGESINVAWTKADDRGNLVAKFPWNQVLSIVVPDEAASKESKFTEVLLTLTGETKAGDLFEGSDTVIVRQ